MLKNSYFSLKVQCIMAVRGGGCYVLVVKALV